MHDLTETIARRCRRKRNLAAFALLIAALLSFSLPSIANTLTLDVAVSQSSVERGERLYLDVLATNIGAAPVANATVQFTVPPNTTVSRSTLYGHNSYTCSSGSTTTCNANALMNFALGTVPAGVSRLVRVPLTVSAAIPAGDLPYAVDAAFSASHTGSVGPSLASAAVQVVFSQTLDVRIAHGHVVTDALAERRFAVVAANRGGAAISDHTLRVELPPGTVLVSAEGGTLLDNAVQWPIPQLAAGRALRHEFVVRNTQGSVSARIPLRAAIRLGATELASGSVVIPSRADAPLALDVAVSREPVLRDERYLYRVSVTNTRPPGGAALENVQIRMHIPANVAVRRQEVLTGASSVACSSGSTAQCYALSLYSLTLGTLPAGDTRHLDIPVLVASDAAFGALAHAQFLATTGDDFERVAASAATALYQTRPLQLSWAAEEEPLIACGTLAQRLTVTNTGGSAAQDLDLSVKLPPGLAVLDADGGEVQAGRVSWPLDTLAATRSQTRRLLVADSGNALNTWLNFDAALLEPDAPLPTRSTAAQAVAQAPSLRLAASANAVSGLRGERIRYRLSVQNVNPPAGAPIENVRVKFLVPEHLTLQRDTLIDIASQSCSSGSTATCYSGSLATLDLGTLRPGEGRYPQLDFNVAADAPFAGLSPVRFLLHTANAQGEWTYAGNATVVEQALPLRARLTSSAIPLVPADEHEYRVLVANQGPGAAAPVGIELRLPQDILITDAGGGTVIGDSVFWQHGQLAAGAALRHAVRYRDNGDAPDRTFPAELIVTGSVDGTAREARSSDAPYAGLQTPLGISVDPVPGQSPGTGYTYTLTVTNTHDAGGSPLEAVTLRMLVPDGATVSRNTITGATHQCSSGSTSTCYTGSRLVLTVGTLQPGESRIVQVPANVAAATPAGSLLETRITAFANTPGGTVVPPASVASNSVVGQLLALPPDTPLDPPLATSVRQCVLPPSSDIFEDGFESE